MIGHKAGLKLPTRIKMNKVIFVDIDGPLMPGKQWFDSKNSNMRKQLGDVWWKKINELEEFDELITFDPIAVNFFNLWARMSDAEFVMATNWARWISEERLRAIFDRNGFDVKRIHEDWRTMRRFTSNRIHEIGDWMVDHPEYTGIIVDDDGDLKRYKKWFNDPEYQEEVLTKDDHDYWQERAKLVAVDYTNGLTLDDFHFGCEGLGIKTEDVMHKVFGIVPLTEEEKKQREEDLELLVRCCI